MKKLMTIFMLLSAFTLNIAMAEVKIGLINYQKIMRSISDGKKIMTSLEKKFNERKKSLKGEEEKIKKAQKDLQKQNLVLSDKAKREKEKSIQKMIFDLQNKTVQYQKEINQLENELKKPIMGKLDKVVQDVSGKTDVAMTFEISTSPVVYAKNRVDLTDDVIKEYNKRHK